MSQHPEQDVDVAELFARDGLPTIDRPTSPLQVLRQIVSALLIIASVVATPVALTTWWFQHHVFDTETFVSENASLINDPTVRATIATRASSAVTARLQVAGKTLAEATPAQIQLLGETLGLSAQESSRAAIESRVTQLVTQAVNATLDADTTQAIWRDVLTASVDQNIAALRGQAEAPADGAFVLQIGPILNGVRDTLAGQGSPVARLIPDADIAIAIGPKGAIPRLQPTTQVIDGLGGWLAPAALAAALAGILIAPRSKLLALWRYGLWTAIVSLLTYGIIRLGGYLLGQVLHPQLGDAAPVIISSVTRSFETLTLAAAAVTGLVAIAARVSLALWRRHVLRLASGR